MVVFQNDLHLEIRESLYGSPVWIPFIYGYKAYIALGHLCVKILLAILQTPHA